MKLQICLLESSCYHVKHASFPFAIRLETEADVEIAEKIDIRSIDLINIDNRQIEFGYSRISCGIARDTFTLTKAKPYFALFDVFENDNDATEFVAGHYFLEVEVIIYVVLRDGKFEIQQMKARKEVIVA